MGSGITILVVDDEPSIRLLCRVNLQLEGYTVLEAGTLDAARDRLRAGGVDVVLLDVHLGAEKGTTLLRELRDRDIRVALLTGSTDPANVDGPRPDAVIGKPFTLERLSEVAATLGAAATAAR